MTSEKKLAANKRYLEQFKVLTLRIKPEEMEAVKGAAAGTCESVSGYILTATRDRMHGGTISPEAMETARQAAEASGEDLRAWISRAISETAQRDELARMLKR